MAAPGKARVHELAKELGVTSKEVLARLSDQGEFVKSASSTVEAPVARRLRESFGGGKSVPGRCSRSSRAQQAGIRRWRPQARPEAGTAGSAGTPGASGTGPRGTSGSGPRGSRSPGPDACCSGRSGRTFGPGHPGSRPGGSRRIGRYPDPRSPSGTQTRAARTARRQQPVLLAGAGRAPGPASGCRPRRSPSGSRSRWPASGCTASRRCFTRQYASSSARRTSRRDRPSRRPASRSGRSSGSRWPSRWRWRR